MAIARAIPMTPTGVAFFLSLPILLAMTPQAHARTPAPIDYAGGSAPAQAAAIATPARAPAVQPRGPLKAYDYGSAAAPASGPTLDLRTAFGAAPAAPAKSAAPAVYAAAPPPATATLTSGPLDIRPPALDDAPALQFTAAPETLAPLQGAYLVQVGAFSVKTNADGAKTRAAALGAVLVDSVQRGTNTLYRVRLGPWPTREAAETARASAASLGFVDARVTQAD